MRPNEMSEWKEFFEGRPKTWEEAYKAFFARHEAEAKEKLAEIFGPHQVKEQGVFGSEDCELPTGHRPKLCAGFCVYYGNSGTSYKSAYCSRPLDKPPEPGCDHTDHYQRIPDGYTKEHEAVGNKVRSEMPIMLFTYCTECKVVLSVKKPECEHSIGTVYNPATIGLKIVKSGYLLSINDRPVQPFKHCPNCGDKLHRHSEGA